MSSRLVMAAGSRNTKRLLTLLNDWPVDKTRKGRDLGELLHKRVGVALKPAAAASSVDDKVSKVHTYTTSTLSFNEHCWAACLWLVVLKKTRLMAAAVCHGLLGIISMSVLPPGQTKHKKRQTQQKICFSLFVFF